jgi:microcystin-dependent protein|tara:strand:+ start:1909 stop:2457 length:549 start_codon:yes stop_codon:yes gene_type:complete
MPGYSDTKYSASGVRVGTIVPHGKDTAPDGFLNCDGSAVSRTTYSALFAEIDIAFGAGDGSNTFNLPDLRDNVALGKSNTKNVGSTGGSASNTPSGSVSVQNHTLTISQIPSHNHLEGGHSEFGTGSSQNANTRNTGNASNAKRFFTANTGGGGAHNHGGSFSGNSMSVLQPYVAVNYIIKT